MSDPEREQEAWQRVAERVEPDEKRRRGMAEALRRYYLARGLQVSGGAHDGDDAPLSSIDPIDRIVGTEGY
ncbi:MAG TPA: hypothetical protein VGN14_17665 [Candidatus Elarobacter sp.]|jgi:hypothetical protein